MDIDKKSGRFNLRYAGIQGFYWMMLCVVIGYASSFLLDKGFTNGQIGIIFALGNILAIIIQPVVADFADRNKKILLKDIVSILVLFITCLSIILNFAVNTTYIYIIMILNIAVIFALHPFINSLSFQYEKQGVHINFGVARGVGSASYAVISILVGYLVQVLNASILPIFYLITMIGMLIIVYTFYSPKDKYYREKNISEIYEEGTQRIETREKRSLVWFSKKYKKFMIFLIGVVLVLYDHSIINNYTIQIINNIGGNSAQMGRAISLAAIVELPTMLMFNKIKQKINCGTLLKLSAVFFAMKHFLTYLAESIILIYIAQCLQMVAFGLFIPAGVYYVKQIMEKEDALKGQAFITMAITLGGVFASIVGGLILDLYNPSIMLLVGAILSIIGMIIMILTVDKVQ